MFFLDQIKFFSSIYRKLYEWIYWFFCGKHFPSTFFQLSSSVPTSSSSREREFYSNFRESLTSSVVLTDLCDADSLGGWIFIFKLLEEVE